MCIRDSPSLGLWRLALCRHLRLARALQPIAGGGPRHCFPAMPLARGHWVAMLGGSALAAASARAWRARGSSFTAAPAHV
eukprot:14262413-Alexandrium_andersonii.AAC.1